MKDFLVDFFSRFGVAGNICKCLIAISLITITGCQKNKVPNSLAVYRFSQTTEQKMFVVTPGKVYLFDERMAVPFQSSGLRDGAPSAEMIEIQSLMPSAFAYRNFIAQK